MRSDPFHLPVPLYLPLQPPPENEIKFKKKNRQTEISLWKLKFGTVSHLRGRPDLTGCSMCHHL